MLCLGPHFLTRPNHGTCSIFFSPLPRPGFAFRGFLVFVFQLLQRSVPQVLASAAPKQSGGNMGMLGSWRWSLFPGNSPSGKLLAKRGFVKVCGGEQSISYVTGLSTSLASDRTIFQQRGFNICPLDTSVVLSTVAWSVSRLRTGQ